MKFDYRDREHAVATQTKRDERNGPPRKRKAKGRFEVMNAFVDFHQTNCTRVEVLTFNYMWRHADQNNDIELSVSNLGKQLNVNRRTAQRALEALADRKLVIKTYTGGLNKGSNRYRLTVSSL